MKFWNGLSLSFVLLLSFRSMSLSFRCAPIDKRNEWFKKNSNNRKQLLMYIYIFFTRWQNGMEQKASGTMNSEGRRENRGIHTYNSICSEYCRKISAKICVANSNDKSHENFIELLLFFFLFCSPSQCAQYELLQYSSVVVVSCVCFLACFFLVFVLH